ITIQTWIAAFLTLSILTFLYKDNPIFRFAENVFAGVSLGYFVGIVLNQTLQPNLYKRVMSDHAHNWDCLLAGLLGLSLYFRYIPKIAWTSRFALAIYIGYYVGVNMLQKLQGEVLPQMKSALKPIDGFNMASLNNLIVFVGVLTVL